MTETPRPFDAHLLGEVLARVRSHDVLGTLQPCESSFDLVACRNVVIYLQRDMHERAIAPRLRVFGAAREEAVVA
jgi:hypothetical protein